MTGEEKLSFIAQQFAHAPRVDPSGTSWLPLPFWLSGASMMVLGSGLGMLAGVRRRRRDEIC